LVLLSSVMTWVNTPPKFKEEKVEGEEGEGAAEEDEEPEEEEEKDEEEEEKADEEAETGSQEEVVIQKPIFFKETDYHLRVPHAKFQHLKTLETVAMSSVKTQPKLRVHVLCSGIRYGNGERIFYDHFQKAWIQHPMALPFIGEGKNLVPTIHVIDLARLVRRVVIENPKEHPYIFAIDKTPNPTQKRLIQSISKGIGTGLIQSVSRESISEDWKDFLTINLKMKASEAFRPIPLKPEQEELEEADEIRKKNQF